MKTRNSKATIALLIGLVLGATGAVITPIFLPIDTDRITFAECIDKGARFVTMTQAQVACSNWYSTDPEDYKQVWG